MTTICVVPSSPWRNLIYIRLSVELCTKRKHPTDPQLLFCVRVWAYLWWVLETFERDPYNIVAVWQIFCIAVHRALDFILPKAPHDLSGKKQFSFDTFLLLCSVRVTPLKLFSEKVNRFSNRPSHPGVFFFFLS